MQATSYGITTTFSKEPRDSSILYKCAEFNIPLGIFIVFQNSLIITHYLKERSRFVNMMFILIATTDLMIAVGEVVKSTTALLVFNSLISEGSLFWAFIVYIEFGSFGCVSSLFSNLILTLVKTINIAKPFYRINVLAAKITLFVYFMFWCFFMQIDAINYIIDYTSCPGYRFWQVISNIINFSVIGHSTLWWLISQLFKNYHWLDVFFVGCHFLFWVQYFIPTITIFVCMMIQIVSLTRSFSNNSNHLSSDLTHINITIFCNTVLLTLCYGTMSSMYFIYNISFFLEVPQVSPGELGFVLYTLPLINAAGFPLIIILRKKELRAQYAAFLFRVFLSPLLLTRWFLRRFRRSQGYQVLD